MKKNVLMKSLIFALALCSSAFAGFGAGNGGDAVVCGDDVYMLDYVEEYGLDRSYEKTGKIDDIVKKMLKNTKIRDGALFEDLVKTTNLFLDGINEYESSNSLITSTTEFTINSLSDIPDEAFYQIPEGCKVEQLIIRRDTNSIIKTEFLVRKKLWDKMNNYQKAVGVVHEASYKYMLDLKTENSFLARYYNRLIFSSKMLRMSDKEYLDIIKEFKINKNIEISGFRFLPFKLETTYEYEYWDRDDFVRSGVFTQELKWNMNIKYDDKGNVKYLSGGTNKNSDFSKFPSSIDKKLNKKYLFDIILDNGIVESFTMQSENFREQKIIPAFNNNMFTVREGKVEGYNVDCRSITRSYPRKDRLVCDSKFAKIYHSENQPFASLGAVYSNNEFVNLKAMSDTSLELTGDQVFYKQRKRLFEVNSNSNSNSNKWKVILDKNLNIIDFELDKR